jgi:hypothetical protein
MKTKTLASIALAALVLGSLSSNTEAQRRYRDEIRVPAGTPIQVRIDNRISTSSARHGDVWNGVIEESVYSRGYEVIPAGSPVEGVVTSSVQGTHSNKARLDLAVRTVTVEGRDRALRAETEPIVADSRRAKKIGAIAGGAAAGALVGGALGGKKGGIIGGLLGGATGYGATRHALRTLVIKPGTVVDFVTSHGLVASRW